MKPEKGSISDRLREQYGDDVTKWPAARVSDEKPMPKKGVEGHAIQGRKAR